MKLTQYELYNANQGQIKINASEAIAKGLFLKDPSGFQTYLAHPTTIKALKKNIFTNETLIEDLSGEIECRGCKTRIDPQYWHFCPICEKDFEV